jgi:hypothetical protein
MSHAVKLLVCAFEASGKSTITSSLRNALVFNMDAKEYGFKVPHVNIKEYEGMEKLIEVISGKIKAYKDKFGQLPETVVFDTVTQLYSTMQRYNGNKYKGFDEHKANNSDTLNFNQFIEDTLIPYGINVVIAAHTIYDEATSRHVIPSTGSFAKAGSWSSVVNDSIFIEKKSNKLIVHTADLRYPARSTLPDIATGVPVGEYSIQDHLDKLVATKVEAEDFQL